VAEPTAGPGRLRWDVTGHPLGALAKRGPDWVLGQHIATVAQDGHVIFCPFYGALRGVEQQGS